VIAPSTVYRLPIRDGNKNLKGESEWQVKVYRLPIRDGNLLSALV